MNEKDNLIIIKRDLNFERREEMYTWFVKKHFFKENILCLNDKIREDWNFCPVCGGEIKYE